MMTIDSIGMMLELLESAYGAAFYKETSQEQVVKLWSVMFADDDPAEVAVAVKDCIATLTFPPKVADIKTRIVKNRLKGQLTEAQVGDLVRKAVDDATSMSEAKKEYEKLPKTVQRSVGSPSALRAWRSVNEESFETVILSMVYRSYRTEAEREASYHALPSDIKKEEQWKVDGAPKPESLPAPKKVLYKKPDFEIRREQLAAEEKAKAARFEGMVFPDDGEEVVWEL